MDKAWQLSGLVEKLKGQGLELGEEAAKASVVATIEWIEESMKLSENKYDDLLLEFLPEVKKFALEQVEKINPEG